MIRLQYPQTPAVVPAMLRLAVDRRPVLAAEPDAAPTLLATAPVGPADPARLLRYRQLCGDVGPQLPLCYPQVLAMPLLYRLLAHPKLPIRALGLIHRAQSIERLAAFELEQGMELSVRLGGLAVVEHGQEMSVHTELAKDGTCLWRSTATLLARARSGRTRPPQYTDEQRMNDVAEALPITVPASMGRAYARVSGDWNPIHLARFSARALGLRGAIAHGMWTLARAIAPLCSQPADEQRALKLSATFAQPIFLPGEVALRIDPPGAARRRFAMLDARLRRLHLFGSLQN